MYENFFSYLNKISDEIHIYLNAFIYALPGVTGMRLRGGKLRTVLASLGPNETISPGIQILGAKNINIGPHFFCGPRCSLFADGGGEIWIGERVALNSEVSLNAAILGSITIGDGVLIGPRVLMRASNHSFIRTDIPIWKQGHTPGRIEIHDDVWIGGNVTILGGAVIQKGAIVAAGAVVNSVVPAYAVFGGVPARFLKWRDNAPHGECL